MGKLWFYSDPHFGHARIIELAHRGTWGADPRPFVSLDEMHAALIGAYRKAVRPEDTVYVLGDFAFGRCGPDIFNQLPGTKHLVIGNHDEKNKAVLRLPWASQSLLTRVKWKEARFILCHYPLETWAWAHHGSLHVHGHSHGTGRVIPHRYDVGVDAHGRGGPVDADALVQLAATETYQAQDHHGHGASSSG